MYKCVLASFFSISIRLGRVLEDFNKSIHNLSCITLLFGFTCLLVGCFFCIKSPEVGIIFNIARRGRAFTKEK